MPRRHREPMRELIEEIVAGRLAPGDMLPREVDLAERFEISRGVARETIRGLEERGLVAVKHGRGATVAEQAEWNVFDAEVLGVLLGTPAGRPLAEDALAAQRLVEREAATLAAERATDEDLDVLRAAVADMEAAAATGGAAATERYRRARLRFHEALVRTAGNRALVHMTQPLYRALAAAETRLADPEADLADHRRVLAAVRDGRAKQAREAIDRHLDALMGELQPG